MSDLASMARVAKIVAPTSAEGPGARMAIWVQGCPLRCPSCCNPEMLADRGGVARSVDSLVAEAGSHGESIEGITLLGGEPFAQAEALARLAVAARGRGLSVMAFSGFTLAELEARDDAATDALLAACDLLVDGPYRQSEPDSVRRWIGSKNQVMHFLSDRYDPLDPQFGGEETIEVRYVGGALTVNGWPSSSEQVISLLARHGVKRA